MQHYGLISSMFEDVHQRHSQDVYQIMPPADPASAHRFQELPGYES